MRLLCTTDIHGRLRGIERLLDEAPNCDLIVVAGDITDFGGREEASAIINQLLRISDVVAVPGNCDHKGVNEFLAESSIGIHASGKVIKGVGFFGVGGSNITPFNTPQEYPEDDLQGLLRKSYDTLGDIEKVLVSHTPPYATKIDKTGNGIHVGSRIVRYFVEEYQPKAVISGHVHEARGIDNLGRTTIVNPGPLHMGYALVDLDDTVSVEFIDF